MKNMKPVHTMQELVQIAETLNGAFLRSHDIEYIESHLKELMQGYTPLGTKLKRHEWFRVQKCDEHGLRDEHGHPNIWKLLYHKDGSPNFGRANFPLDKTLYAAWDVNVALDEMGASVGDYFQLVKFTIDASHAPMGHVLGLFTSHYASGECYYAGGAFDEGLSTLAKNDWESYRRIAFIDSVITELYRRPYKNPYEYKLTALYNRLFAKMGALIYPSVASPNGINIAIPDTIFDESCEIMFTDVLHVEASYNYGFYDLKVVKHSHEIAPDGEIKWISGNLEDRTLMQDAKPGWKVNQRKNQTLRTKTLEEEGPRQPG